jgi:uncharacterized YccA/Bax inhibitor family protein
MGIFKGGNPAISEKTFQSIAGHQEHAMTVRGTLNKFGMMLVMLVGAASFTWDLFYKGENVLPWMWGSLIGGFVLALIMMFRKQTSPYLALGYALCEGLFLGAISAFYDYAFKDSYPGIIMQAVLLTFGASAAMFLLYHFKVIQATPTFRKVVLIATASVGLFYLAAMIMRMFGMQMPFLHENGIMGIGISLVIVVIASLNLILDFDMIENGAKQGAPKYFEWFSAFGLMVTIVWLYLEMLRLLSKLSSRN